MAEEMAEEKQVIGTAQVIYEKASAGFPALYLQSSEDIRSQREIKMAAEKLGRKLFIWTLGKGLVLDGPKPKLIPNTAMPSDLTKALEEDVPEESIVILRLLHHFLDDPSMQAALLDMIPSFKDKAKMLIVLTPVLKLPPELEKEFTLVESSLPNKETLGAVLDGLIKQNEFDKDPKKAKFLPSDELRKELIESATGMTTTEAENAFSLALIRGARSEQKWDPKVVLDEKCSSLKKTGLLEFVPTGKNGMKQVGGMANYKEWLAKRRLAFTDAAKEFGLPAPKGILMVGPPGSGKSLGAKATSEELKLPLLRCDVGALLGSLVGQSEANVRLAIQTAEAVAPCILWLDEIEKGFAGSTGGQLDSGVGTRVLGKFLTWMQEKTSPVFVYATANDVTALPPEFLRKGRFDEMFSVLLPNPDEREEILRIHLEKRNKGQLIGNSSPKMIDLATFVKKTESFSGAEIEAAIVEAMYAAFARRKDDVKADLNSVDLEDAIASTRPLSQTMAEKLKVIQEWCENRTRPANAKYKAKEKTTGVPQLGRKVGTGLA